MTVPAPRSTNGDPSAIPPPPDGRLAPPVPSSSPPRSRLASTAWSATSWPSAPASLDSDSSIAAQSLALIDRTLADEDRTRRAHGFIDSILTVTATVVVCIVAMVSVCIVGGISCLVLGLHGVGPVGGKLLVGIGAGQLGLGTLAGAGGAALRRRVSRWLRSRA